MIDWTRTVTVADAGANFNGDKDEAKKLIKAAAEAGVDCIKFQTYTEDGLCHPTHWAYDLIRRCQLPRKWHEELADYAAECGIAFNSTPFDFEAVELLDELWVPFWKVASGDLTYRALIERMAEMRPSRPVVLSQGASSWRDVTRAAYWISSVSSNPQITILHCVPVYPATPVMYHLPMLQRQQEAFRRTGLRIDVGISDHTTSIGLPAASVAFGGRMVEKHITMSREQDGPDHGHALEPHEFAALVQAIRDVEDGTAPFGPPREAVVAVTKAQPQIRRACYWARDVRKREVGRWQDLITTVRPAPTPSATSGFHLPAEALRYHDRVEVIFPGQKGEPVMLDDVSINPRD